jgi:DNA polymerase
MNHQPHQTLVEGLIDHLRFQRECGEVTVELEPETVAALAACTKKPRTSPPAGKPRADEAATPNTHATPRPAPAAVSSKEVAPGRAVAALAEIAATIAACRKCVLCKERTTVVPGQGNPHAPDVLFIGEAPGADEDRQGLAFVGRAGQLLTKMIVAMGYTRDEIFIANICKCRPPGNRQPAVDEMAACLPYLKAQIAVIRPRTIVAMGNTAILGLLGSSGITRLRGIWSTFEGIPLMPTYHPAYLLRFPSVKREAWDDLKKVLKRLDRPIPAPAAKTGGEDTPP